MKNPYKLSLISNRVIRLVIFIIVFLGQTWLYSQNGTPTVVFPNGGQTLTIGSTVTIQWSGTALGSIVGIDYTIDNWTTTTWLTTSYSNASANTYTWVVPNTPGTQCKIGIFNISFQGDISDNFFTIAAPSGAVPTADFDFSGTLCTGTSVLFADQSLNAPTSWSWSVIPLASITSSLAQNTVIKFPASGIYTVTLIPSNLNGSGTSISKTISINASPVVSVISSATVLCKGNSATLSVTGADTYSWSTSASGASIVINPSQTVTYTVSGTTISNGCKSVSLFTQSVSACTALDNFTALPEEDMIRIYPNPVASTLNIEFKNITDAHLVLTDIIGNEVMRVSVQNKQNVTLDMSELREGIYFLKVFDTQGMLIKKIIHNTY